MTAEWTPADGDYAQRRDRNSNVHIVQRTEYDLTGRKVTMACRAVWYSAALRHASDSDADRRPCHKCWDSM